MTEDTDPELKANYRRLIKRYHPDTTIDPNEKMIFGRLTALIIDAYGRGDLATLRQISEQGLTYRLAPADIYGDPIESEVEVEAAPRRRSRRARLRGSIWWPFVNPYGLSMALRDWSYNGRLYNAMALVGGGAWTWIVLEIWIGIGCLSRWLEEAGISHEGPIGFALIVLRGVLILGAFRIVVPVAVVVFRCGVVMVVGVLACWIASAVLGVVHPYLSVLAKLAFAGCAVLLAWKYLDESEEE